MASSAKDLMTSQVEDTKSALGEIPESMAQVASFGIDEINQILHALDNPFLTAIIPIKIPHPFSENTFTTINMKINISPLRAMCILAIFYRIWQCSPGQNPALRGKWNWEKLVPFVTLIDGIVNKAEAFLEKGFESVATSRGSFAGVGDMAKAVGDFTKSDEFAKGVIAATIGPGSAKVMEPVIDDVVKGRTIAEYKKIPLLRPDGTYFYYGDDGKEITIPTTQKQKEEAMKILKRLPWR
jgi:hypothetical protein